MTAWEAHPWIEFDGQRVNETLQRDTWESVAVAALQIDYGRDSVLEHSDTGSARVQFLARPAAHSMLHDPMGRSLVIGYTGSHPEYGSPDRTIFRGRVDSSKLDHFKAEDGEDLLVVELQGPGRLAEVARTEILVSGDRAYELATGRRDYLATFMPDSVSPQITGLAGNFPYKVAPMDYKDTSVLSALQELGDTSGHAVIYDPQSNMVQGMDDWYEWSGETEPVLYLARIEGLVGVSPHLDGSRTYDAGQSLMTPAEVSQSQTVDQILVEGFINFKDGGMKPGYGQRYDIPGARPGMQFKVENLSYWSEFINGGADASRDASMARWQRTVATARQFTHPPIERERREGWPTFSDMITELAGVEQRFTHYVMGSVYSIIDPGTPFCRPIGGTIKYLADETGPGYWDTEHNMAAVRIERPIEGITVGSINPSHGAAGFTYDEFHPSLSLQDLGNAEQGL